MYFQVHGYQTEIPRTYQSLAIRISEREATRLTSRRIHHTARTNVPCIHYHSSRYGYRARYSMRALLTERRAGCSCTRYARISALAQLVSLLGRPGSYLDSSPDKQACSPTVRAFRQASTTKSARVFAYLSATPHKVWGVWVRLAQSVPTVYYVVCYATTAKCCSNPASTPLTRNYC